MARVLLVMPPLPQPLGAPYLGQQYLAASLLRAGHRVRCLDLAAPGWKGDLGEAAERIAAEGAELVGMTLFTWNVPAAYALAAELRGRVGLLVAGGPHATILPEEPLAHGFDLSLAGEGELSLPEVAGRIGDGAWPEVAGARWPGGAGPAYAALEDLDALALPLESYPCFDMDGYGGGGAAVTGGLMTSRGCPARCTFCSNHVTGRVYRWRSAQSVVGEMKRLAREHGITTFPFWDDAFTASRPRLEALCEAIVAEPALRGCTWTCITPGVMVKPRDLARMRAAGCVAVNFGIESGDPGLLRAIKKGQRPEHVLAAVRAAKAEGMTTVVNIMCGFPGEGPAELDRTMALIDALAPDTDFFNNRGVLVPFPGTPMYAMHHEAYGFTGWWLDPARTPGEPPRSDDPRDAIESQRLLEHDPTLDVDFFRYAPDVREKIAAIVRRKARHNAERIRLSSAPPR